MNEDTSIIDLDNLPPPPWTRDALGQDTFKLLADLMGAGYSHAQRNPSLDPRGFGRGWASKQIASEGYALPQGENEKDADYKERTAKIANIEERGAAIQAKLDASLPAGAGSTRSEGMPKLTPAKTTIPASMIDKGFAKTQ